MPRKCFDVFYEVFGKRFVWFSLGFHVFEVFCPVWVLYNIKRGWDTPPGAHRAAPPHRSFGPAATSNVVPGALVPDGYAVATHDVAHLLQRTVVCVCSKHGASCCKIALPIFSSCTVARVCKKHPISSPNVFLPIFLSCTVLFRPRRNVRASSAAVVPSSRRYPCSSVVLCVRCGCFLI